MGKFLEKPYLRSYSIEGLNYDSNFDSTVETEKEFNNMRNMAWCNLNSQ